MTTKYKLVPIEPTEEMFIAAREYYFKLHPNRGAWPCGEAMGIYKAMLEASPAQESEPVGYTSQGYIDGVKNSIGDLGNFAGNFFKRKWENVNIPLYTQPPADKDTERYRWIKSKAFTTENYDYGAGYDYVIRFYKSSENIDEAIDEAMKG